LIKMPDQTSRARAVDAVLERLAGIPDIEVAGGATGFPTVTPQRGTRFALDGRTLTAEEDGAYFIGATPGYFQALRTRTLRGRTFDRRDDASAVQVAVINRTLSDRLFAGHDPIGQRLRLVNSGMSGAPSSASSTTSITRASPQMCPPRFTRLSRRRRSFGFT
jgi:hypothetical protein